MVTLSQQLQGLRSSRRSSIRHRDLIRAQNEARLRRGLSRDAGLSREANLENRKVFAIGQLIEFTRRGILFAPGEASSFIQSRVRRAEARFSFERRREKQITKLASAERISRAQAAKSIGSSQARLKKILAGRPISRLTSRDLARLSPIEKRSLGIKISPRKVEPPTPLTKRKPFDKPPSSGIVSAVKIPSSKLKNILDTIQFETSQKKETLQTKLGRGRNYLYQNKHN